MKVTSVSLPKKLNPRFKGQSRSILSSLLKSAHCRLLHPWQFVDLVTRIDLVSHPEGLYIRSSSWHTRAIPRRLARTLRNHGFVALPETYALRQLVSFVGLSHVVPSSSHPRSITFVRLCGLLRRFEGLDQHLAEPA